MNHVQHKFLITAVVFIMAVIGVFTAARFKEVSISAINISLLFVNTLLLLITLGILLQIKENFGGKIKKEKVEMIFKDSKSQAALEFLATYGWAFLVILIMIGTLAYFGILNPSKILPNRCNFGAEFQCIDYQISSTTGTFKLSLKNNVGEPIDTSSITLSTERTTAYTCDTPPVPPVSWKSGEVKDITWSVCSGGGLVAGEKGKILITVRYNAVVSGSNYTKEVKGEVLSTVI